MSLREVLIYENNYYRVQSSVSDKYYFYSLGINQYHNSDILTESDRYT